MQIAKRCGWLEIIADKVHEENKVLAKTKAELALQLELIQVELELEKSCGAKLKSEVDGINSSLMKANEEKQILGAIAADKIKSLKEEVEKQKKRHLSNARITELQQSLNAKEEKVKVLLLESEQSVNKLVEQTAQIIAIKETAIL